MGRGRKGLIEQSQKKPKQKTQTNSQYWWGFHEARPDKKNSAFFSNDFLEALKRMEPKEVVDILFK